jgi:hypothetical protein
MLIRQVRGKAKRHSEVFCWNSVHQDSSNNGRPGRGIETLRKDDPSASKCHVNRRFSLSCHPSLCAIWSREFKSTWRITVLSLSKHFS